MNFEEGGIGLMVVEAWRKAIVGKSRALGREEGAKFTEIGFEDNK